MSALSAEVRGLRLAYGRWGPPDATDTFVLVHGLGSTRHIWDLVIPRLAERYAVVALDQRGHGESEQPDSGYDFGSIVDDLSSFLECVGVRGRSVMVGHSWGASVVVHFAAAHPELTAGVVLVDGGTSSPGERWTWDEALARMTPPDIDGRTWDSLRQRMSNASLNGLYEDPRVAEIGRSLFRFDAEGRIYRRLRIPNHLLIVRALWEQRPAALLSTLACPVLILPARQTSDNPEMAANKERGVQRALELNPGVRVRWFDETIHDIPLQRPGELASELLAFADHTFAGASKVATE